MARDIEAGRAFVRLSIKENMKGLKRMSAGLKSWGASLAGIGKRVAVVGGSMAAPFLGAIKAASDMEEVMNKFNVVFGDSSKEVKAWSDSFAGSIGRSKKQMAEFMAGSQDLFMPLGFAADAATDMSKQVTGLAVDLASFNNMADGDVIRDLHAALTGSGEVMKKYGVIVSEAAVKQELLNQGMDPKKATNQQKVQARLNIIMAGTTAAQGDAIRSAGSFANQMKALQGTVMDTAAAVGTALLPVVTPLVTKVAQAVRMFADWASQNQHLIKIVAMVVGGITAVGIAFLGVGGVLSVMGAALGGVIGAITTVGAVIGAIVSPIGLVVAGVVGATAAFFAWTDAGQQTVAFLQGKFGELLGFVQGIVGGISDAFKSGDIELAGKIAWGGVLVAWENVKEALWSSWNSLANGWDEFTTGLASVFDSVVTSIRSTWTSVVTWIGQQLLKVWGVIEKALAAVGLLNETTDIGGAVRIMAEDSQRQKAGLASAKQQRDMQRGAALSARKSGRDRGASSGLATAQQELADLLAQAATQAASKVAEDAKGAAKPSSAEQAKSAAAAVGKMQSIGTFSAAAAGMSFQRRGESAAKKTEENTRKTVRVLEKIEKLQGENGLAFS